jgi:hypothetical protein
MLKCMSAVGVENVENQDERSLRQGWPTLNSREKGEEENKE